MGVTLPETLDGPRRGSGLGGRVGIKGAPSSEALDHVTVAGAPCRVRAKAATSGDPQQRARGGRGRLCLLPPRQPPHHPSPCAPSALHSPGFPSGLARLGSCQGTELTFASREFQLAADQISGRARLSGHRGGAAPPPPRRAKRAPDGNKDEDAAPPASRGRRGERKPRWEKLPTRGRVARSPRQIWDPGSGQVSALAKMIFAAPLASSTNLISSWALCPLSPGRNILPSLISCRGSLVWLGEGVEGQQQKETEAQMYRSGWDFLVG